MTPREFEEVVFHMQIDTNRRLHELQIQEQEYKTETARIALEAVREAVKTDRANRLTITEVS